MLGQDKEINRCREKKGSTKQRLSAGCTVYKASMQAPSSSCNSQPCSSTNPLTYQRDYVRSVSKVKNKKLP